MLDKRRETSGKKMTKKSAPAKKSSTSKNNTHKLKMIKDYGLSKDDLKEMLKTVYTSRRLDDTEIQMRKQSKAYFQISGAGHEGILSATAKVLRPSYDWFLGYYRDRALCLGLGVTPYEMLCQANGNTGDTSSYGRQMPAHWGNKKLNIVSKSSCTGTQFLQACGIAEAGLYLKQLDQEGVDLQGRAYQKDEIVYVSTGDGTTSQGEFWEALTTATVNKLPVLFMVEDNGYAISVPVAVQTPEGSISKALKNFPGLKIFECDGNCPIESYATVKEAEKYLRAGNGPAMIHASCTRPYSHSLSDDQGMYRTKEEMEADKKIDVFHAYPDFLVEAGYLSEKERQDLMDEVNKEIREALERALETPWPEIETATKHVFSEDVDMTSSEFETPLDEEEGSDLTMAGAINRVLKKETKDNAFIRIFGQDVADFSQLEKLDDPNLKGKGGVFKLTSGVQREARDNQVFNSPLAEANIIGRAIGMAMRGLRPVVEIQFFDYIWTSFMQLKNEMATTRYRSGADFKCPMVVRVPIGGYLRGGAMYHSQCGESFFTHIPGIRVAYPSNAQDAAGLLRTAIRGDDPVMFLEHKHLYYQGYNRAAHPGDDYMIPFGKARVAREGSDATVICWGALVQKSLDAAKKLEQEKGYSIEVIDARTLSPFDMEALKKSLEKTNRLLIAHEETKTSGYAGEIAARVNEECFESLDAPIMRLTTKDSHIAYCPQLEDDLLPQVADVEEHLIKLLNY